MSLLDLNLDEVKDLRTVEPGEYKVRVLEVRQDTSQNGNDYIMARLEIVDVPEAKNFNHLMMLPGPYDDEKKKMARLRSIKNFVVAFGHDPSGTIDLDKFVGEEAWAVLIEEDGGDFGMQNRVKRFT